MALGVTAYSEAPFSAEPSDNTVVVSGLQITGATGSVTITGELGVDVPVTGQSLTVTNITTIQDTLAAFAEAPFASESPDTFSTVNVITTGNANIVPTGIELTMQENTPAVVGDANVSLTGQAMTSALGQVDAFSLIEVPVTGINLTSQIGDETVTADANVPVTGFSASVSLPSPLVFNGFGDAQISTAQSKFGGASLLLDGTGDYLESEGAYNFGSDPFTIDMWVRPTSGTQDGIFFDSRDSTSNDTIALRQSTDNLLVIRGNVTLFNINNVFSVDTWVHIAVTRGNPFGNTYSVFVDGVKKDSSLFGATPTAANIHIGSDFNGSNNWEGYMDELRVANVDEYGGTDFTPPTSAYTADQNIPILLHFDGANGSTTFTNDGVVEAVTVTADADVSITGQELTMQENAPTVTGDANVTATALPMTATLGTAVLDNKTPVDLTGFDLTMQEGTATAPDSLAILTGIEMTISEGNVKNIMWSEVNTGTIQPWTEVDTAA